MAKDEKVMSKDPDPRPFLFVSPEQRQQDAAKDYDAKKTCWIPGEEILLIQLLEWMTFSLLFIYYYLDEKDGFVIGELIGTKGDLVTVSHNFKVLHYLKIINCQGIC